MRAPGHHRRVVVVALSSLITVLLLLGWFLADIGDVVPGPLTVHNVQSRALSAAPAVRSSIGLVRAADLSATVSAKAVASAISTFGSASGLGDDYSVAVSQADGTIVGGHDADVARQPASTLKILTALAAASRLDMGSTLDTTTYLDSGESRSGTPTVILKGNGDMLLSSGDNDPEHINGRAGLRSLASLTAKALRSRGVTTVRLAVDDTLFGSVRSPAHVGENNDGGLYFTPISSLAVDGGRQWASGKAPTNPDVFDDYPTLSTTTASGAASVFVARLKEQGIKVEGQISSATAGSGLTSLATVHSATLTEIMAFMLRHSDNTLAEEFGRLLALKMRTGNSPTGAVTAVERVLRSLKIPLTGLTMADCSGLSPGSRVTVRTLVAVQEMNLGAHGVAAAAEGLSVSGLMGTAKDRFGDSGVNGLLRVKTGSLSDVTSMAGTVSTKSGGVLAFAVVVNNPKDYESARAAIDSLGVALAGL
ncbi:D-alanyl-D-alanine carboxypeptidase/D-alanyl-D-alanine-endopeptidase [uncultured Bifidobacterium sp.]|uniref:D-alanyl-D-alanine carboxypeptidase/D-alanyl-D-alanine endopeptidase n=1 Tax=uncultured Bifidobacterium sp. TaxID=165187 RepID=UPI002633F196|nr:D-alanyl-D-alanine carboxypeptidase/D-alanyl-D-alanine-endopeptidase [uncultured Bifidobacterium sp.]